MIKKEGLTLKIKPSFFIKSKENLLFRKHQFFDIFYWSTSKT